MLPETVIADLNLAQTQRSEPGHARLVAGSIEPFETVRTAACLGAIIKSGRATTLADDAPLAGGDAWPRDAAASASAAESYSAPIRAICATSATALSLPAERRARPQARPAGSLSQRITTTSADPCTLPAARPGERAITAIGVSPRATALRLKTSQQRKLLVRLAK